MDNNLNESFLKDLPEGTKKELFPLKKFKVIYDVKGVEMTDVLECLSVQEAAQNFQGIPDVKIKNIIPLDGKQVIQQNIVKPIGTPQQVETKVITPIVSKEYEVNGIRFKINDQGKLQRKDWVLVPDDILEEYGEMSSDGHVVKLTKQLFRKAWLDVEELKGN